MGIFGEMKPLEYDVARTVFASTEEVLERVCRGCAFNREWEFDGCDIKARYGAYGEHPAIVGEDMGARVGRPGRLVRVKCLAWTRKAPKPKRSRKSSGQLNLFEARA